MFEALSVREYDAIEDIKYNASWDKSSGSVSMKKTHYVVVIALNIKTRERKRIAFSKSRTSEFLGRTMYEGYTGDYELLVPGDVFEIQETATFKKVVITEPTE